jgi:hypothetical protein
MKMEGRKKEGIRIVGREEQGGVQYMGARRIKKEGEER